MAKKTNVSCTKNGLNKKQKSLLNQIDVKLPQLIRVCTTTTPTTTTTITTTTSGFRILQLNPIRRLNFLILTFTTTALPNIFPGGW